MSDPFDYLESRDDADGLIADFGGPCLLRRISSTGPAWDPVTTSADYPTIAAVVDFTSQQRIGTDILVSDRRALVAAGPLTLLGISAIAKGDVLVINGTEIPVIVSKPINPAGTVVMHDVQCRF